MTAFDMETANRFGAPYPRGDRQQLGDEPDPLWPDRQVRPQRGNVGNKLGDVQFSQFAQMLGGHGEEVREAAKIGPALQRAREAIAKTGRSRRGQYLGRPQRIRAGDEEPDDVQVKCIVMVVASSGREPTNYSLFTIHHSPKTGS